MHLAIWMSSSACHHDLLEVELEEEKQEGNAVLSCLFCNNQISSLPLMLGGPCGLSAVIRSRAGICLVLLVKV